MLGLTDWRARAIVGEGEVIISFFVQFSPPVPCSFNERSNLYHFTCSRTLFYLNLFHAGDGNGRSKYIRSLRTGRSSVCRVDNPRLYTFSSFSNLSNVNR